MSNQDRFVPKNNELSPKFDVVSNQPMASWEAISVIIQSLTGGVSTEMRDELIIGCLRHITGKRIVYESSDKTFTVTDEAVTSGGKDHE